jgi:hypothetical protein
MHLLRFESDTGLMTSTADNIRRLSWISIESFEHSHSDMESLVDSVRKKEVMKTRMLSGIASVAILFIFCYLSATFFSSGEDASEHSIPSDASSGGPKFLLPFSQP